MNHTITHFHKNRFEWAFQAKKEFINRFVRLDVIKPESSSIKELTIYVYGPTQVGKMNLILTLLGIKQEMLGQISRWLRGKRRLGESSTVTVMRYEQSNDDYFHVRLPNGETKAKLTGEQLEAALLVVRPKVEIQNSYSGEPVVIEIPSVYFEARNVKMNIVDLPGVGSAELNEVEHVKQYLKHWIPDLDMNELSFNWLTKLYIEAVEASNQELEENAKQMDKYTELIDRQEKLINHETNQADTKYRRLVSEILFYKEFSTILIKLVKNVDTDSIKEFVTEKIEYNSSHKKASVINGFAAKLQQSVETELELNLRKGIVQAKNLKISSGYLLQLPELDSIPKIHKKMDAFWFIGTYEKALYKTRGAACDWVEEMYKNYNDLLLPVLHEAEEKIEQLLKEAEAFQLMSFGKIKKRNHELDEYQEIKNQLEEQHREIYEMWKQDREHAAELQRYFIKYWLQYKEELQHHFLHGNPEERFLAAQYLHLLQQDGEEIIESLNFEEKNEWLEPNYPQKVNTIKQ